MAQSPQYFSFDNARIAEFLELWGVSAKKHEVSSGNETRRQCLKTSGESKVDGLAESKRDEG